MHAKRWYLFLLAALMSAHSVAGQSSAPKSLLQAALGNMYGACLFESQESNNPFARAAALARQALAPGLSGFIESNLAAIPLTPPSLDLETRDGEGKRG